VRVRLDVPEASAVLLRVLADDVEASRPLGADVDVLEDPDEDGADPDPESRVLLDTGDTPCCDCCRCWGICTCCG